MSAAPSNPSNSSNPATPQPLQTQAQAAKRQRVLACILCQQRKIKCNRKFPCANCVRSGTTCVPATLAPRRKRRTFPEKELLSRLQRYEELMRQNNVKFEPFFKDSPGADNDSPLADDGNGSDEEHPESLTSPEAAAAVGHDKFKAKSFWRLMNHSFRDGDDSDSSQDDLRDSIIKRAWSSMDVRNGSSLLGSRQTLLDLSPLHPEPAFIFRLWQIYLENVDPLLKLTHTPTLQARIIQGIGNIAGIGANMEALMFGIYAIAIKSLNEEECVTFFGTSKEDFLRAYHFGCEQALLNAGFLRTDSLDCAVALLLYLLSTVRESDHRSLSTMFATGVRIAHRLRLHDETARDCDNLVDAELQRRLWWAYVLFDYRITEIAGNTPSNLEPTWNCKVPININDSDLRPEAQFLKEIDRRPSDSLFVTVRYEIADYVRHTSFHLDFINPTLKAVAREVRPNCDSSLSGIDALERHLEEKYFQYCDLANPMHFMTIFFSRAFLARYRLICHNFSYPGQQTPAQRDTCLSYAFQWLDCDRQLMSSPKSKPFLWMYLFYFPFPAYLHISQDLKKRLVGKQADDAWERLSANYEVRYGTVFNTTDEAPVLKIFAKLINGAWESREAEARAAGQHISPPRIVSRLRQQIGLPSELDAHTSPHAGMNPTDFPTPPIMDFNDPLMGFTPYSVAPPSNAAVMMSANMFGGPAFPTAPLAGVDIDQMNLSNMNMGWDPNQGWEAQQ